MAESKFLAYRAAIEPSEADVDAVWQAMAVQIAAPAATSSPSDAIIRPSASSAATKLATITVLSVGLGYVAHTQLQDASGLPWSPLQTEPTNPPDLADLAGPDLNALAHRHVRSSVAAATQRVRETAERRSPARDRDASAASKPRPTRRGHVDIAVGAAPSPLELEATSLAAVDRKIRTRRIAAAQSAIENHFERFPSGFLLDDARGLSLLIGCLGTDTAARERAATWLSRRRGHVLYPRIVRACDH